MKKIICLIIVCLMASMAAFGQQAVTGTLPDAVVQSPNWTQICSDENGYTFESAAGTNGWLAIRFNLDSAKAHIDDMPDNRGMKKRLKKLELSEIRSITIRGQYKDSGENSPSRQVMNWRRDLVMNREDSGSWLFSAELPKFNKKFIEHGDNDGDVEEMPIVFRIYIQSTRGDIWLLHYATEYVTEDNGKTNSLIWLQ